MASDAKVTEILALCDQALNTPSQLFELPRVTVTWLRDYIRRANAVLGEIASIVSFEPAGENDIGEHCGCVDAIREALKNLAGGTEP